MKALLSGIAALTLLAAITAVAYEFAAVSSVDGFGDRATTHVEAGTMTSKQ